MGRMVSPTPQVVEYLARIGGRETPAQRRCRLETEPRADAEMQITAEQAASLQMLVRMSGAQRCLEVGVFTGYSALAVALALPAQGKVVALDISKEFTDLAKGYWKEAGVAEKIDLRIGPAAHSLDAMISAGEGPFDFAFIDADKPGYDAYYEKALKLLRPGSVMALDNMLLSGKVADPNDQNVSAAALRALNEKIYADDRVDMALTTIGDGMTLCIKR
ncbi:MAG: class I SAM-dependent methyltransferase [Alphaproteobacteria bacterium]|nr:class I SAM-dependent methyltransferase [Alphaproteobacteria bacterium]